MYQSLQENKKKKDFVIVFFIGNRNQINRDLQIGDFFITIIYNKYFKKCFRCYLAGGGKEEKLYFSVLIIEKI